MRGDMRVGLALKEIRETEVELPQLHMVLPSSQAVITGTHADEEALRPGALDPA
jgi:hypothetical protein